MKHEFQGGLTLKIYVLLRQNYDGSNSVCISENIMKIRTCICKQFNLKEDYPEFEIWDNGEILYRTSGNDVLHAISKEIIEANI